MHDGSTNGLIIGLVSNLDDPERLGRVKVTFPTLDNKESDWARLCTLMAGAGRGSLFRPEKGDEVLVGFAYGDPRCPYILGALWSQTDQPPADDGNQIENNWRLVRSRSGHIIKLDDSASGGGITIEDKNGNKIVLDTQQNNLTIQVRGDINVKADRDITIEAGRKLDIQAKDTVTVKGHTINLN